MYMLCMLLLLSFGSLGKVKYAYVAELQSGTMTEETDMAGLIEHTGMVAVVNGIGVVVAAVGGYVVTLAGFPDVAVHNYLTVHGYGDVVALNTDLFLAPLAACA